MRGVHYLKNINNSQSVTPSKEVYTVKEISEILNISLRGAYNYINTTDDFKVFRIGKSLRVSKPSFDEWFKDGSAG